MHLREYLHPRARSTVAAAAGEYPRHLRPPTATFPRLPTPREHGEWPLTSSGGLATAHIPD